MAFRWCADYGPKLNACLVAFGIFQGIRTSIAKNPYIYVIFQGLGLDTLPPPPPLDPPIILTHFEGSIFLIRHTKTKVSISFRDEDVLIVLPNMTWAGQKGGTGGRTPPPLKNYNNIGFS